MMQFSPAVRAVLVEQVQSDLRFGAVENTQHHHYERASHVSVRCIETNSRNSLQSCSASRIRGATTTIVV
jgi:hypothetical protein